MNQKCPICNNDLPESAGSCTYCGFRIPGATQSFQPVSVADARSAAIEPASQKFELRVVRGPQTGIQINLRAGELSMGRDPSCDIFLNDMTVSRSHATLEVGQSGCVIRDQNSFNGVWVNDKMVDACPLHSGDVIQIGAYCLVYQESGK